MGGIDKAVLESAIDAHCYFRGPDFLDHPPQSAVGKDPGSDFVKKQEQDALGIF